MKSCVFCNLDLDSHQNIILSNEECLFLQLNESNKEGGLLEGAGVIVPKKHRETVFDLTESEWSQTYSLLQEVKKYLDQEYNPQGYNLGWNCGAVGGQHISHAHFHVIPRFKDEPFADKGIRYIFKSKKTLENRKWDNS